MQTIRRELRTKFREVLTNHMGKSEFNFHLGEELVESLADIALEVAGFQKREEKVQLAIDQANVKVDAMLNFAKEDRWHGREKMPEPIRDLMDVFVECTGIKPLKGNFNDWFATGSDWVEVGAKQSDVRTAYEKSRPDHNGRGGFPVVRPGSLTSTIQAVVGERRKSDKPTSNKEFMDRYLEK